MARILIGEPDAEIRNLLEVNVRRLGHEPVIADGSRPLDAAAAAAVLEPSAPDQLELAHRLRQLRADLPLIFVSTEPSTVETRALAPVQHLLKPFQRSELAAAIEAALQTSADTHQAHT